MILIPRRHVGSKYALEMKSLERKGNCWPPADVTIFETARRRRIHIQRAFHQRKQRVPEGSSGRHV